MDWVRPTVTDAGTPEWARAQPSTVDGTHGSIAEAACGLRESLIERRDRPLRMLGGEQDAAVRETQTTLGSECGEPDGAIRGERQSLDSQLLQGSDRRRQPTRASRTDQHLCKRQGTDDESLSAWDRSRSRAAA